MIPIKSAAIIGAGMAGLTAARTLRAAGIAVTIYDKGRKPGGRLATRHAEGFTFNHGCQFATARDAAFHATLLANGAAIWPAAGAHKLAGVPDMASLARNMAAPFGESLHAATHVSYLNRAAGGWHLSLRDAAATDPALVEPGGPTSGPFDAVILAIPAPQAANLLAAISHPFAPHAAATVIAPCWALMLGFPDPINGPATLKPDESPISWLACENTRPGADPAPTAYTIHAGPAWSRAHLEDPADAVIAALREAFTRATGITATPCYTRTHRWRYALAETPLGQPYLLDSAQKIGVCGDWCLAGKLEAAYLSGQALGIKLTT
jgi:predicted NAD/FAD-dependent oxidoreductase